MRLRVSRPDLMLILNEIDQEILYVKGVRDANKRYYKRMRALRKSVQELINELDHKSMSNREDGEN